MNRHQIEVRAADPPARLPNLVPVPGHGMNINRRKRCLASAPDSNFFPYHPQFTNNISESIRSQSLVHEFVEMAGTPKYDGDLFYQVADF